MRIYTLVRPFFKYWRNYFNFSGAVSRKFFIVTFLEVILAEFLVTAFAHIFNFSLMATIIIIYSLLNFIPSLSLGVRRLRDVGVSPWLILTWFLGNIFKSIHQPIFIIIGYSLLLIMLILLLLPSNFLQKMHPKQMT